MKTGIVLLVLLLWGCVHSGYQEKPTTTDDVVMELYF
jgi:hypothetical protein